MKKQTKKISILAAALGTALSFAGAYRTTHVERDEIRVDSNGVRVDRHGYRVDSDGYYIDRNNHRIEREIPRDVSRSERNDVDPTASGYGPSTTTTTVLEESDDRVENHNTRSGTTVSKVRSRSNRYSANKKDESKYYDDGFAAETTRENTRSVDVRRDVDSRDVNSNAKSGLKADNTGKNVRDRNMDASITPMDQSQGFRSDVETTRKIRREIVADDSFSTYAKNIKIITLNGVVTLRGPVRDTAEKTKIANITHKFVAPNMIVNKLEIAPSGNAR
jgi:hyperosmotically inducible protein